jgi:transcriptional regulator with XRE-family HTH domain
MKVRVQFRIYLSRRNYSPPPISKFTYCDKHTYIIMSHYVKVKGHFVFISNLFFNVTFCGIMLLKVIGMFSKRLRSLREEKGITQIDLGNFIGFGHSTISQYESGKRMPDYETLTRIANLFDVTVDYLIGRTDIKTPYPKREKSKNIEEFLEENVVVFDGEPLDEEVKEGILDFLRLTKKMRSKNKERIEGHV